MVFLCEPKCKKTGENDKVQQIIGAAILLQVYIE